MTESVIGMGGQGETIAWATRPHTEDHMQQQAQVEAPEGRNRPARASEPGSEGV
jgi:hypothetical protein